MPETVRLLPDGRQQLDLYMARHAYALALRIKKYLSGVATTIPEQQIKQALITGMIDETWRGIWREYFDKMVEEVILPAWKSAMLEGAKLTVNDVGPKFAFSVQSGRVAEWVGARAENIARDMGDTQYSTFALMAQESSAQQSSEDDKLFLMLLLFGLTERQARANFRNYHRIYNRTQSKYPELDTGTKLARQASKKYARTQVIQRAQSIANAEIVTAFNAGRYFSMMQAIEQGDFDSSITKVWLTCSDSRVCSDCSSLHGMEVPFDAPFFVPDDNVSSYTNGQFPPLHINCRCTLQYKVYGPNRLYSNR